MACRAPRRAAAGGDLLAAKRARKEETATPHNRLQFLPMGILCHLREFCRYDGQHTALAFCDALVSINADTYTQLLHDELCRHVGAYLGGSPAGEHHGSYALTIKSSVLYIN